MKELHWLFVQGLSSHSAEGTQDSTYLPELRVPRSGFRELEVTRGYRAELHRERGHQGINPGNQHCLCL
jgi:hypothetical protein